MKQNLLQKLETYVIVTIITILIWLYAEGATIKPYEDILSLRFISGSGTPLIISPESQLVEISYKCRKDIVNQVKDIAANPIILKVNENPDGSNVVLLLQDRLMADDSPLAHLGINLDKVDPKTITLDIEPLVTRKSKVQLLEGTIQLVGQPVIEPAQVDILMPQSAVLPNTQVLLSQIDDIDQLPTNVDITRDLNVSLPIYYEEPNVKLLQQTVKITFRIASGNELLTITRIPVYISVPPSKLKQYNFTLSEDDRVLTDIQVEGPADAIAQIRNKQFNVHADLRPTPEQMDQGSEVLIDPIIQLPAGVTLTALPKALPVSITRKVNGTNGQ